MVIGHNEQLCYADRINWASVFTPGSDQRTSIKFNRPTKQCCEYACARTYARVMSRELIVGQVYVEAVRLCEMLGKCKAESQNFLMYLYP